MDPLTRIVLIPAMAAVVCYLLRHRAVILSRLLAVAATGATVVLAWLQAGTPLREAGPVWLTMGTFRLAWDLNATAINSYLCFFVALFGLLIALYSTQYRAGSRNEGRYYGLFLVAISGALLVILADNLMIFLVGWEVVTVAFYLLVLLGREGEDYASAKSFAVLGFADAALLFGLLLLWLQTGTMTMSDLGKQPVVLGGALSYLSYALILAGAMAKAGAMPLHTWIPEAAKSGPVSVTALLPAALDKLLGIYLLARIALEFFRLDLTMQIVMMVIGAVTIVGAVMMAMMQHDLRKLLAYHAISQVGYMVLGIGTGTLIGVVGGVFHMLNHAIYKSCLFLCAGSVQKRTGTMELDKLGGLARTMPLTFACCVIAALAISGIPPLNGFASKWLVYQGVLQTQLSLAPILLIAAVFGSALTLASFVKVLHSVYLGTPAEDRAPVREVGVTMWVPMVILAALCLIYGVFAHLPLNHLILPAIAKMSPQLGQLAAGPEGIALGTGMWNWTWATILLLVGVGLGLILYLIGRATKPRVSRMFVGGEIVTPQRAHVAGTGFYESVKRLPMLKTIYRDAESEAYDPYRVVGQYGSVLVEFLRRLHTGILPQYVAWCLLGLALILLYIFRMVG